MKNTIRNIYFIISSILMIVLAIYVMVNIDFFASLQESQQAALANLGDMGSRVSTFYENGGIKKLLLFFSGLQIILSSSILITAFKKHLMKNKGKMIAISFICFFTSELLASFLLSLLNVCILILSKREQKEDFPDKEKLPLPANEKQRLSKKQYALLIILAVIYLSEVVLGMVLPETISSFALITLSVSYYVILFITAISCLALVFPNDIVLFCKNVKAYLQHILPKVGIMYLVYFTVSIAIVSITNKSTSMNQAILESLPLWITAPLAIIWAPIVEEILYRGCLRKLISKESVFIVVSGLIFGIAHTISEGSLFNIITLAVPYTILGGFFAYIYAKTDNICSNILTHAFHNAIGVLMLILLNG